MKTRNLFLKFNQSVGWNACLYTIYKILFTGFSFLLYMRLTTQNFSTWANINATVYLTLLWLDFGLRKSIPRFAPIFSKNQNAQIAFIKNIIGFKIITLLMALPLLIYAITQMSIHYELNTGIPLAILGALLFFIEGISSVIKSIYHAHFWNKQFNSLSAVIMVLHATVNWILIARIENNTDRILMIVFCTKIIASFITVLISTIYLIKKHTSIFATKQVAIDSKQINKKLITHSTVMWGSSSIKSLTERNFLIPLLTLTVGPEGANMFKIANDGALLFYRVVLKTIGSTDTSLLAHIESGKRNKKLLRFAFKKLIKKVATLCFPILALLGIISLIKGHALFANTQMFYLFLIMTTGYLLETLLSPYERILEVKSRYALLFVSYTPYILIIVSMFITNAITPMNLIYFVLIIHSVRLASSLFMMHYARREYKLNLSK